MLSKLNKKNKRKKKVEQKEIKRILLFSLKPLFTLSIPLQNHLSKIA
jgi:hypothetical protein